MTFSVHDVGLSAAEKQFFKTIFKQNLGGQDVKVSILPLFLFLLPFIYFFFCFRVALLTFHFFSCYDRFPLNYLSWKPSRDAPKL